MINLFDDQTRLVGKTRDALRRNKFVLMQAATGAGKTVMSASMIMGARAKGTRAMIVVPRKTLLRQTAETLMSYDLPFTYFAAGYTYNPYAQIILASAQTLGARMDKLPDVNLVFFDECHYGGGVLDKVIKHYRARGAYGVGLSATPTKLDGRGMGEWYDEMVEGETVRWLIDNKRLSDYRMFAPNVPDMTGIKTHGGDYAQGALNEKMENDKVIIGDVVRHYKTHAMGKLGLTFCTSRKHNEITASAYRSAGIPAMAVDGLTPPDELKRIIKAFARREILQLVNCDLLTFGFDLASAAQMPVTVETMHDVQPTQSLAKQSQEWGRVLRYELGKTAMIFDHAGNWTRHGLPDDDREWTLDSKQKRTQEGERAIAVKQCPKCFYAHRPMPACPNCNHVYEVGGREVDHIEGELTELNKDDLRNREKKERLSRQAQARTLDELIAEGKRRGMKNPYGWASHVYTARKARR